MLNMPFNLFSNGYMKFTTIISRHIIRELISPFVVSLLFLSFIFLMAKIPEFTNMIVNHNASVVSLFLLLIFSFPRFLEFIFPMSVMISVMLTFMRMAGDNEIIALKGGGVSLYRLLPPILLFCTVVTGIAFVVSIAAVPWSKHAVENKTMEIAQSSLGIALQPQVFNTDIQGMMIYISGVDSGTKKLNDVFIEDSRTKDMVVISTAPEGILVLNKALKLYTLRLYNGRINRVNISKGSVNTIFFSSYDINIDLRRILKNPNTQRKKELDEMNLAELKKFIDDPANSNTADLNEALMEFHGKFSLPFACLCLGILAFPLGIQSVSLKRSSGFGLGLFFFIIYYILFAVGLSAGESGAYPPFIGMWLPDFIMLSIGIYLLHRNVQERPVKMPLFILKGTKTFISQVRFTFGRKKAEK